MFLEIILNRKKNPKEGRSWSFQNGDGPAKSSSGVRKKLGDGPEKIE